jgi:hypothetical protein
MIKHPDIVEKLVFGNLMDGAGLTMEFRMDFKDV